MNRYTTRGGVYLDLTKSPYSFKCGAFIFKFTSAKKKEVFIKQLIAKNQEFYRFLKRNGMLKDFNKKAVKAFYYDYVEKLYQRGNR